MSAQFIPYGRQAIDEEDIAAVAAVLRAPMIARGPGMQAFERALCAAVGAPHAVACASGTAGLHLACLVRGIGPGDEVIVPAITFAASANCAAYCGATVVFADIESDTACVDATDIARKVTPRTRAIIPVHFAGQSCDMGAIAQVAREAEQRYGHKVWVFEDACHVLDSTYRGAQVGTCAWSDAAVFSFHPVKHITTGEGGAVTTRDAAFAQRLALLRGHGITKDAASFVRSSDGPWYHEQIALGYNYFITDIQCALGQSQLAKRERFSARRRVIMQQYAEAFARLPHASLLREREPGATTFHLAVLRVDFAALGTTRVAVVAQLQQQGIGTQVHYLPVYRHPYHERWGARPEDFPHAEAHYAQCLTVPLFPAMTDEEVERVITGVTTTLHTYAIAAA